MGAAATTAPCGALLRRSCGPLLALLLCFQVLRTSQAFKLRGSYEEKVPLTVIVPDPSPQLSGLSPAPLAAPPPVFGGGGGDDDMRPRLPTERWRRGRGEARRSAAHPPAAAASSHSHQAPAPATPPSASLPGPARGPAPGPEASAPAPDSAAGSGGSASIKSSPAVPVPRGVTDTATILPMPAPGEKRQEVGAATSVGAGLVPPLLLGLLIVMMASFGL
ncbi:skin secretory protein xP2-like [Panicum miliaceum]|uniref:Skin secretory protein xP2-like n=1 Tax=Panicum miliaceum TaxID=4540 RepID=A0A3L6QM64_PANMI|nr:skin secretory protein xP2-like [Panicum miliaceum]